MKGFHTGFKFLDLSSCISEAEHFAAQAATCQLAWRAALGQAVKQCRTL